MMKSGLFQKCNTLTEKADKLNQQVDKLLSTPINFLQINNEDVSYQIRQQQNVVTFLFRTQSVDEILKDLGNKALDAGINSIQGFTNLFYAKKLLEYLTANKLSVLYSSVLFTKINYAISLIHFGFSSDAVQQLVDCDKILKIKGKTIRNQGDSDQNLLLAKRIQNKLLRLRIIYQCTLIFSESGRNQQAFELAKLINKINNFILNAYIVLCDEPIKPKIRAKSEQSSPSARQEETTSHSAISEVLSDIVEIMRSANILPKKLRSSELLRSPLRSEKVIPNKKQMLYHTIKESHPLLNCMIIGLMQLSPVTLEQFYPIRKMDEVINEELILEIIMLSGLGLYCLSTEDRFLTHLDNADVIEHDNQSNMEMWLCKSLEIFYRFVPHCSQVLQQIIQVHKNFYGINKYKIVDIMIFFYFQARRQGVQFSSKSSEATPLQQQSSDNQQFYPFDKAAKYCLIDILKSLARQSKSVPLSKQMSHLDQYNSKGSVEHVKENEISRPSNRVNLKKEPKVIPIMSKEVQYKNQEQLQLNVRQMIMQKLLKQDVLKNDPQKQEDRSSVFRQVKKKNQFFIFKKYLGSAPNFNLNLNVNVNVNVKRPVGRSEQTKKEKVLKRIYSSEKNRSISIGPSQRKRVESSQQVPILRVSESNYVSVYNSNQNSNPTSNYNSNPTQYSEEDYNFSKYMQNFISQAQSSKALVRFKLKLICQHLIQMKKRDNIKRQQIGLDRKRVYL